MGDRPAPQSRFVLARGVVLLGEQASFRGARDKRMSIGCSGQFDSVQPSHSVAPFIQRQPRPPHPSRSEASRLSFGKVCSGSGTVNGRQAEHVRFAHRLGPAPAIYWLGESEGRALGPPGRNNSRGVFEPRHHAQNPPVFLGCLGLRQVASRLRGTPSRGWGGTKVWAVWFRDRTESLLRKKF